MGKDEDKQVEPNFTVWFVCSLANSKEEEGQLIKRFFLEPYHGLSFSKYPSFETSKVKYASSTWNYRGILMNAAERSLFLNVLSSLLSDKSKDIPERCLTLLGKCIGHFGADNIKALKIMEVLNQENLLKTFSLDVDANLILIKSMLGQ